MTCHTKVHELGHEQPKTSKELLDIATRYASCEEAVGATFILGNTKAATSGSQAAPSKATIKGAKKGSKKGQKQCPQRITVVVSINGDDEKVDNSSEECVVATLRNFKRQMWQPKDHFEKLLDVICPTHSYPIKHKRKNCTMMKNFMTSGAFSKGRRPEGDLEGKSMIPFLGGKFHDNLQLIPSQPQDTT
jgi:hypothetical protein